MIAPTTNNRPSTFDDLKKYECDNVRVLTRPQNPTPAQAKWFGNALASAPAAGFVITEDMHIDRPKTEKELESELKSAQRIYDNGHEQYAILLEGGAYPKWDYQMRAYCEAEGIETPARPEAEEEK